MAESINTIVGREALARIVRQARGEKKLRPFAREVGVSHGVIYRLERAETKNPPDSTLAALVRFTEFSFEELKAILASRTNSEVRQFRRAEDLLPYVNQLPETEAGRLAQMIIARLAGLPLNPLE